MAADRSSALLRFLPLPSHRLSFSHPATGRDLEDLADLFEHVVDA
eukprot:COSAG02_NODE_34282_length_486_cov_1.062016_1_plen_44_part_10